MHIFPNLDQNGIQIASLYTVNSKPELGTVGLYYFNFKRILTQGLSTSSFSINNNILSFKNCSEWLKWELRLNIINRS